MIGKGSPARAWALLCAVVFAAIMLMPWSWFLHIVRALTVLGLLALLVAFVVAICTLVVRAAIGNPLNPTEKADRLSDPKRQSGDHL